MLLKMPRTAGHLCHQSAGVRGKSSTIISTCFLGFGDARAPALVAFFLFRFDAQTTGGQDPGANRDCSLGSAIDSGDRDGAYSASTYRSSERTLAVQLASRSMAAIQRCLPLDRKAGGGDFSRGRVLLPAGVEDSRTRASCRAPRRLKRPRSCLQRAVVKLNEGFSGRAMRSLFRRRRPRRRPRRLDQSRPTALAFGSRDMSWAFYGAKIRERARSWKNSSRVR